MINPKKEIDGRIAIGLKTPGFKRAIFEITTTHTKVSNFLSLWVPINLSLSNNAITTIPHQRV
jgi:hypothetical protein